MGVNYEPLILFETSLSKIYDKYILNNILVPLIKATTKIFVKSFYIFFLQ